MLKALHSLRSVFTVKGLLPFCRITSFSSPLLRTSLNFNVEFTSLRLNRCLLSPFNPKSCRSIVISAAFHCHSNFNDPEEDDTDMATNRYACDYARLGTSSCKKCKQKLEKGSLRLAKVAPNPFADGEGEMRQYFHPKCMFETFLKARSTTKIIEGADDIEDFTNLKDEDKDAINELIKDLATKKGTPKKTGTKKTATPSKATPSKATPSKDTPSKGGGSSAEGNGKASANGGRKRDDAAAEKDDSFRQFRKLCSDVAGENGYNGKTAIVEKYTTDGSTGDGYHGDLYLLLKLLMARDVKTVYNLNSKQLVKLFSQIFVASLEKMVEDLENGDVAETIFKFFEISKKFPPQNTSTLSIQEVEDHLQELSQYTKEDDQLRCLTEISRKCTSNDLKMIIRLIKHDLRINCGAKFILDALDPNAYEAFKASRDLKDVVDRVLKSRDEAGRGGLAKKLSVRANLMTPVQPMLAEACKSVDQAFKRCKNGMYAEIKYDGERVQVHKQGNTFHYYSRSLKPVTASKVQHFEEFIPKAFPKGYDLILDSEVLLIDTKTGKPLPFGTLGVHKKSKFKDANVGLFVFDCLHYNGENLMDKPIKERREILMKNMKEIPHRILFSEMKHVTEPTQLSDLMMKVFREGLEGLVLKDVNSIYEPGKRHWLKVKKDYLANGAMADTADLVVLGAYFGTGSKGGIMSIFLMGVHDADTDRWCTVTKCGSGFDDKTLNKLQKEFDMIKISKDPSKVPSWLNLNKTLIPDFVVADPKKSQVWEITGAEFSQSDSHTAGGISIRFPRCTKMRDDKTWKEATDLKRLRELFAKSKEHSDIPDKISETPRKKEQLKKKRKKDDDDDNDDIDDDDDDDADDKDDDGKMDTSDPSGNFKRSIFGKRKSGSDDDDDESPTKRHKKDDSRPACAYGESCYQKNSEHRKAFYHPNNNKNNSNSNNDDETTTANSDAHKLYKNRLPDTFKGMKFYLPKSSDNYSKLKRYIIAFDGDIVELFDRCNATHVVISASQDKEEDDDKSVKFVTAKWVWSCIKARKILLVS